MLFILYLNGFAEYTTGIVFHITHKTHIVKIVRHVRLCSRLLYLHHVIMLVYILLKLFYAVTNDQCLSVRLSFTEIISENCYSIYRADCSQIWLEYRQWGILIEVAFLCNLPFFGK